MNKELRAGLIQLRQSLLCLGFFVSVLCSSAVLTLALSNPLDVGWARLTHQHLPIWVGLPLYALVLASTFISLIRFRKWADANINNKVGRIIFELAWMAVNIIGWLITVSAFLDLPNMTFLRKH